MRPKGGSPDPPLLVATDLDGCLLDGETYSWRPARRGLEALRRQGSALVLCSSKTRAEMAPLVQELGLAWPFIVENGGAIVLPRGHLGTLRGALRRGPFEVVVLGSPRAALVTALEDIARETGLVLRGWKSLEPSEIARLTHLPPRSVQRARRREYDEPFLLVQGGSGPEEEVRSAAWKRGLQVVRGGRFLHLTGPSDKGRGLRRLLELYASAGRRFRTVGLGDSEGDLALLSSVERPIVVPLPGGEPDEVLGRALPWAERTSVAGPEGWNEAILAVLQGSTLPRLSAGR